MVDKSMKILVVDDVAGIRNAIRKMLRELGFHNVTDVGDGVLALEMLRNEPFGLVLCEWAMQPMSGLQLLREVRADRKLRDIPFIMITAESKTDNVVAAKNAGVSGYMVKPFNVETLKQKMVPVLGNF